MKLSKWISLSPFVVVLGIIILLAKGMNLNSHDRHLEVQDLSLTEFSLPSLYDSHRNVTHQDLLGEVTLLHFWASWCGVCHREHAVLMQLKQEGVSMIGIDYRDNTLNAQRMLSKKGNPYTFALVDLEGRFGVELGVYGTPETYIIDHLGNIRFRHAGPLDYPMYLKKIKPIIVKLNQEKIDSMCDTDAGQKSSQGSLCS